MPDGDRSLYANTVSVVDYQACLDEANPKANPNESRKEFCVQAPKYEDYIISDFVSEIDSNFRTLKGRESRAVSCESAGGTGALSLTLRNPEIFSSAASHSGIVALLYHGPYPFESGQGEFISELDVEEQSLELLAIYCKKKATFKFRFAVTASHWQPIELGHAAFRLALTGEQATSILIRYKRWPKTVARPERNKV